MATTKRACPEAATVLGLPHVLTSIAQCFQSPSMALAFLSALPPSSLDAPLAATKALLTRPGPFVHTWPHLGFDDPHSDRVALALEALPALVSLLELATERTHWSMSAPETMVLADVVASWPLKLTYIDTRWSLPANARYPLTLDSDDVCNLLRRCTRLRSVTLFATEEVAAVLAAMTTPAHRLQKLHLAYEGTLTLDWATLLQPWLSSGHARHVSFNKAPAADMAGLARALATTSSLRSLAILENDALIRAFLALRMPLHQLTKLHLSTRGSKLLRQFLKLCALASLTSFALDCYASFATVTLFVSHMPALRHLSLGFCFLGADADDASRWPHLESIEFCDVDFGSGARDAVLAYLARVQGLQKMSFDHCYTLCRPFVGLSRTLVRLINDGLTLASFESTALDDVDASHLALVLRRSRNLLPFTLNVMGDDFTMVGIRTLLLALATCASVCIKIDISPYCFEEEIEAFLAAHGMSSVLENASSYALYSPSMVLEA